MSSDATAALKQKQPAGKSNSWTKPAITWATIGLVICLAMLLFVLWIVGITQGREFDAGSWTFRKFNFLRNPLTGNQFSGINRSSDFSIPPNITTLTTGGPIAPGSRWDLVEMYKGPAYCVGQAQILLDYLSAFDQQNNYYWQVWTTEHPQAAPILWAAVRDCVHLPRYDRLAEIFETARSTSDPAKLKAQLNKIMVDIAKDEAELQASLGNTQAQKRAETLLNAYLNEKVETIRAEIEAIP